MAAITPRTSAIYVATPNNPDGAMLVARRSSPRSRALADRHDLWILSDEVYEDYGYDAAARLDRDAARRRDRTVTVFSFAKSYAQAGLRVGYALGPEPVIATIKKLVNHSRLQRAGRDAARGARARCSAARRSSPRRATRYRAARDRARARLLAPAALPPGGAYLWVDFSRVDAATTACRCSSRCAAAGVLLAPGSAFGEACGALARLCFTGVDEARLDEGIDRINACSRRVMLDARGLRGGVPRGGRACDPATRVRVGDRAAGAGTRPCSASRSARRRSRWRAGRAGRAAGSRSRRSDDGDAAAAGLARRDRRHPGARRAQRRRAATRSSISSRGDAPTTSCSSLISGGASALVEVPRDGLSLARARRPVARADGGGAPIARAQRAAHGLSRDQGRQARERVARARGHARVSDVIGDDLARHRLGTDDRVIEPASIVARRWRSPVGPMRDSRCAADVAERDRADARSFADAHRTTPLRASRHRAAVVTTSRCRRCRRCSRARASRLGRAHRARSRPTTAKAAARSSSRSSSRSGCAAPIASRSSPAATASTARRHARPRRPVRSSTARPGTRSAPPVSIRDAALDRCDAGTALAAVGALVITGPTGINHARSSADRRVRCYTRCVATWTTLAVLDWTTKRFTDAGIGAARLEAQLLLAHVLQCSRTQLYMGFDKPLGEAELAAYRELIKRRLAGEPVAYLARRARVLGPAVLRRSERARAAARYRDGDRGRARRCAPIARAPCRVLDLCTGSGAIAIALAKELPAARVIATEFGRGRVAIARKNAERNGSPTASRSAHGDLWAPVAGEKFDLIVSNPPYIATAVIPTLSAEVKREPRARARRRRRWPGVLRSDLRRGRDAPRAGRRARRRARLRSGRRGARAVRARRASATSRSSTISARTRA